ncbi:hypothetical protein HMPREF1287_01402 [Corynebacterium sp. KPL1986]|nr:hypothetical protein HMPREF1293_02232 [Corynebacterium sp. KPL1996]ERS44894.1 hypothetical protein HMPREF1287_01402 [Corynebacterium sp. KPL1986]ERS69516.1 hypothetical protein HMPREF1300_02225 [Corynebacterium sp. KPL2004]ERS69859.1 hypothetical protein HMPREF1295_02225 [Corynebacterium sp. KPL1998]
MILFSNVGNAFTTYPIRSFKGEPKATLLTERPLLSQAAERLTITRRGIRK